MSGKNVINENGFKQDWSKVKESFENMDKAVGIVNDHLNHLYAVCGVVEEYCLLLEGNSLEEHEHRGAVLRMISVDLTQTKDSLFKGYSEVRGEINSILENGRLANQ